MPTCAHQRAHRRAAARGRRRDQPCPAREGAAPSTTWCSTSRATAGSTCCTPTGAMPLGTAVVFSSIAGRFGNAGQTDYSAANDLLCKSVSSNLRRRVPDARDRRRLDRVGAASAWPARGSIPKIMAAGRNRHAPAEAGIAWIRRELAARHAPTARSSWPARSARWRPSATRPAASTRRRCGADGRRAARRRRPQPAMPRRAGGDRPTLDPTAQRVPRPPPHRRHPGAAGRDGHRGASPRRPGCSLPSWHVAAVEDVDFLAPLKFYRDEPRELTLRALRARRRDGPASPSAAWSAGARCPGRGPAARPCTSPARSGSPARRAAEDERAGARRRRARRSPASRSTGCTSTARPTRSSARPGSTTASRAARMAAGLPADHDRRTAPMRARPAAGRAVLPDRGLLEAGTDGRLALPLHVGAVRLCTVTGRRRRAPPATARRDGDGGFSCAVRDDDGDARAAARGLPHGAAARRAARRRLAPMRRGAARFRSQRMNVRSSGGSRSSTAASPRCGRSTRSPNSTRPATDRRSARSRCTPTRTPTPGSCGKPTRPCRLGPATYVDPADGIAQVALPGRGGGRRGAARRRTPTRSGSAGDSWPSMPSFAQAVRGGRHRVRRPGQRDDPSARRQGRGQAARRAGRRPGGAVERRTASRTWPRTRRSRRPHSASR